MATWQFDVFFIKRHKLQDHFKTIPQSIDEAMAEELTTIHDDESNFLFDAFLPRCDTWSKNAITWGNLEGDCYSVLRSDGSLEVRARIDARNASSDFIKAITMIAKKNDCLLLKDDMSLIEPDYEILMSSVCNSSAYKFACNPQSFIRTLRNNDS